MQLTPKFDIVLARSNPDFERIQALPELEVVDQDYMSVTLQLKPTEEIYKFVNEIEEINAKIEAEEERVRGELSAKIAIKADALLEERPKVPLQT